MPTCKVAQVVEKLIDVLYSRLGRIPVGAEAQAQVVDGHIREIGELIRDRQPEDVARIRGSKIIDQARRKRPNVSEDQLAVVHREVAGELWERQIRVHVGLPEAVIQKPSTQLMGAQRRIHVGLEVVLGKEVRGEGLERPNRYSLPVDGLGSGRC